MKLIFMINKRIIISISFILLLVNTSCKKNFYTTGNGVIDSPDFKGIIYDQTKIITYDEAIDSVFSTNLPLHALGDIDLAPFGELKAEFATTLNLPPFLDSLGTNIKIVSAKVLIPYFAENVDDNGTTIIKLDSVYGTGNLDIKIHELGYLLPSYDPNTNLEERRKYYSNFDLTDQLVTQIADTVDFIPSIEPYITYKRNEDGSFEVDDNGERIVKDSLGPHFIVDIDTTFIRHKIFDRLGDFVLQNKWAFQDYFRGIYFEIEDKDLDGKFMMMDFGAGTMQVAVTHEILDNNNTPDDPSDDFLKEVYKEINFKFDIPKMNYYENDLSSQFQTALNNSDPINGDDHIFVKGDAASGAVVHLFDDQELATMKAENWLVNKAELIFYVDESISNDLLPENLVLYDKTNQRLLLDMADPDNINNNNQLFGGHLDEDENGNKIYKFKLTQHIKNIIENNEINVDLWLRVVTDPKAFAKTVSYTDPDNYNPKGVVLHGNQSPIISKRPKLVMYYTKPEIH
jgi:hypothetical protein